MAFDYGKAQKSFERLNRFELKAGDKPVEVLVVEIPNDKTREPAKTVFKESTGEEFNFKAKSYYAIIVETSDGTQHILEGTKAVIDAFKEAGEVQEGDLIRLEREDKKTINEKTQEAFEFLGWKAEILQRDGEDIEIDEVE